MMANFVKNTWYQETKLTANEQNVLGNLFKHDKIEDTHLLQLLQSVTSLYWAFAVISCEVLCK
jgi:hypothetical protein